MRIDQLSGDGTSTSGAMEKSRQLNDLIVKISGADYRDGCRAKLIESISRLLHPYGGNLP